MKIPYHQPLIFKQKALLPKDMEEVAPGTLPTHLVSNNRNKVGYIHANANGTWINPNLQWFPYNASSHICKFDITPTGELELSGNYIPKRNTRPIRFEGVQIERWTGNKIFPKTAIFQESDCIPISPGKGEFYRRYEEFPFQLEDNRIEFKELHSGALRFDIVGKLTQKEWAKLSYFPLPFKNEPFSRNEVIPITTGSKDIVIEGELLKIINPLHYNDGEYYITRKAAIELPTELRSHIIEPSALLESANAKVVFSSSYWCKEERISICITDALNAGVRCKELYWLTSDKVEISPENITKWPQTPIPCHARGKDGMICESLQIDHNIWGRSDLKRTGSNIFITKSGDGARAFGIEKKLEKDAFKNKQRHVKLTLGSNYAEKFKEDLGEPPNSVEALDKYMIVASLLLTEEYVKISNYGYLSDWVWKTIKQRQIYHDFGLVSKREIKDALNTIPEMGEEAALIVLLFSNKVNQQTLKNKIHKETITLLKEIGAIV